MVQLRMCTNVSHCIAAQLTNGVWCASQHTAKTRWILTGITDTSLSHNSTRSQRLNPYLQRIGSHQGGTRGHGQAGRRVHVHVCTHLHLEPTERAAIVRKVVLNRRVVHFQVVKLENKAQDLGTLLGQCLVKRTTDTRRWGGVVSEGGEGDGVRRHVEKTRGEK